MKRTYSIPLAGSHPGDAPALDRSLAILEQLESRATARICVEIGARLELYNNAPGRILLAFQPQKTGHKQIARLKLTRPTERTITSRENLKEECRKVVACGYSTDWDEADEGIHCVAATVLDPSGHLIATLWVSAIARRMPQPTFESVGTQVKEAAREVERRLQP